jgi:hypothetical protein
LAAFHALRDAAEATSWRGVGWAIANDRAVVDGDAHWVHSRRHAGDGLYAELRATELTLRTGGELAVGVDSASDDDLGFRCAVERDRDGDGLDELAVTAFATRQSMSLGVALTPAHSLVLTAWRVIDRDRAGRIFCRAVVDRSPFELVVASDDTATGRYGFAATEAVAAVSSIVAYTFPVNPCTFAAPSPDCL